MFCCYMPGVFLFNNIQILILLLLSWFRGLINVFEKPAITLELIHAQALLTVAMAAILKIFTLVNHGIPGKTTRMQVLVL